MNMKTISHNVVIVAHPDDETLFFGGLILSNKDLKWSVIVATDANADGDGARRAQQLQEACRLLGVYEVIQWDFPDIFEQRLDQEKLIKKISDFANSHPDITEVYTHGPAGEYGHPHHQDVSFAVHSYFLSNAPQVPVWSIAYNSHPQKHLMLAEEIYHQKREILQGPYHSEVARFMHLLPCTWSEGFHQLATTEWRSVKEAILNGNVPEKMALSKAAPHYQGYLLHLKSMHDYPPRRPF